MGALQDSYEPNDSRYQAYGARWPAQTFVTSSAYIIESVELYLYRDGDPGTVTVSLYAADGAHKPTGAALATMTMTGTDLPNGSGAVAWYNFVFDTPYALSNATEYVIVVHCTGVNSSNDVNWRYKITGAYANGTFAYSTDSGGSWAITVSDATFRTYSPSATYVDLTGTFDVAVGMTGSLAVSTAVELTGTFTVAIGVTAGALTISNLPTGSGGVGEATKTRLISIGNNRLYYEDA